MDILHSQQQFITEIKEKVRLAQYEALKAVNLHLVNLYWELGKAISQKQAEGWAKPLFQRLQKNCKKSFQG